MSRKRYNSITIPKELNTMVNKLIQKKKKRNRNILTLAASLLLLSSFTLSLNISPAFADSMSDVPIIGNIANWLTFRDYVNEKENLTEVVTKPIITIDEDINKIVNGIIDEKVSTVLVEAEKRVEEYKDAYLATGGTEEGFNQKNMTVAVDYQVYHESNKYVSFRVYTHETLAAAYAENLYFTINLETKTLVTLDDLMGSNSIGFLTQIIKSKIKEEPETYFEEPLKDDWQVRDDIDFYLKDDTTLVVVFQKYEIAPGAKGRVEFEIPIKN